MPKGWEGIISRKINRKISIRIARFILRFRKDISPNKLTIISTITGVISGIGFALGSPMIGGLLSQLASILDGVDGDVARITGKASSLGAYLDAITDRVADASIIIGATVYLALTYNALGTWAIAVLGMLTLSTSMMVSYSRVRAEHDLGITFKTGISGLLANRDVRLFAIMVGGVVEEFIRYSLIIVFVVISVACTLTVASRIYLAIKSFETHQK